MDRFTQGVDRLRETAKWLVAVFAAIGGTMLAGTQLSSIGQFEWGDPRLNTALLAGTVALVAVGTVIWFAVRVLTGGPVSIRGLVKDEAKSRKTSDIKFIQDNPQLLVTYGTVKDLHDAYYRLVGERDQAVQDKRWDEAREKEDRVKYLGGIMSQLLYAVRYDRVYRRFQWAVRVMFICGFLAAAGIVIFVWAANPEDQEEDSSEANQASLSVPVSHER